MRRSVGRTGAPASIPKQPGRAARFTDVGAAGQIGSRTDLPHCTSRHRVDVAGARRSEEHTSELQSQSNLVCRLLLEKKKQELGEYLDDPFRSLRAQGISLAPAPDSADES